MHSACRVCSCISYDLKKRLFFNEHYLSYPFNGYVGFSVALDLNSCISSISILCFNSLKHPGIIMDLSGKLINL